MQVSRMRRKLGVEFLESRRVMAVGGGFTDHGLVGTYYNDSSFDRVAFVRKDVRLDFDWGMETAPGGSNSPVFRTLGTDNYSVRWVGSLVPKFNETYSFVVDADDRVKLEIKTEGASDWETIVDQTELSADPAIGTYAMQSGATYLIRVSYVELSGAAKLKLEWQSDSTPREVIEPLTQTGINKPDGSAAFADLVNSGRNRWEPIVGDTLPEMDANGWPMSDAWYIAQESLNQGLDIDPLIKGRIDFSFRGKAVVSALGNVKRESLTYSYDDLTNTTTGSFLIQEQGRNIVGMMFENTTRTGEAGGPGGITDLKMMRPVSPDALTTYDPREIFTTQIKQSLEHFTVVRFQLVANQQQQWTDRTLPTFFNQSQGSQTEAPIVGDKSSNGWSWEHIVMLANETGRDLMLSVPLLASGKSIEDTDSYVVKLANLIRYGSDGVNPYTAPQSNPVYPPLNSNLHVYLELGNELWNFASVFYTDWENLNRLTRAAVQQGGSDFAAINFDGLSLATNSSGEYESIYIWRQRMGMLRTIQISNIFRSVFGDEAMPNGTFAGLEKARVRPIYEWQYANGNQTAETGLDWADRYFNKTAPNSTWSGPALPPSYFLYGGGGATYYGAVNGNGLTDLIADAGLDAAVFDTGYHFHPSGTGWVFEGNAGIARDAGSSDDIPPSFNGSQVGFLTDAATMTTTFTVPSNQISDRYAVAFKAHNRLKSGASIGDKQNLRVYLDYGTDKQLDITAKTFSQPNGYTPPSYEAYSPWKSLNVPWYLSDYYFTQDVALAPGSSHTITIRGMGDIADSTAINQTAFLENIRITSVDRIFDDGLPSNGEATGQTNVQGLLQTMNTSTKWAAAFGLAHVAYEGGWSLGGDDGGSYIQMHAKYGDSRALAAQRTYMDWYHEAGGQVLVLGTYPQWPSWSDYFAEQGLLDLNRYPIVQAIDAESRELRPTITNAAVMPQRLLPSEAAIGLNANVELGRITTTGGWISWSIGIPATGTYQLSASLAADGQATLLVDNELVDAGVAPHGYRFLTEGLHTLKVRSRSGPIVVESVQAVAVGASSPPDVVSLNAADGVAVMSWRPVRGATGYIVRYGTEPNKLTSSVLVDGATNTVATVAGLKHNQRYFFGVSARNASGIVGLPSTPRSLINLVAGQYGDLSLWDFAGLNSAEGTVPSTLLASSTSSSIVVGDLTRGSGLIPASDWVTRFFPGRFSSFGTTPRWSQTFVESIAKEEFVSFSFSPSRGKQLDIDEIQVQAWYSSVTSASGIGLTYSIDGGRFETAPFAMGEPNTSSGYTFDLRSISLLKELTGVIVFRIYLYGLGDFNSSGIGFGDKSIDMVLRGSVTERTSQNPTHPAVFWQNPNNPFDVSGSDGVDPIDVLLLINAINQLEVLESNAAGPANRYYYDVDGDNVLSPLDVLLVINAINEETSSGEGEESSLQYAPWTDLHWLWRDMKRKCGTAVPSVF